MKEIQSRAETVNAPAIEYALASTYVPFGINYPSIPDIPDVSRTFTKNYAQSIQFTAILNVTGKEPFETDIKSIKLGAKDILFDKKFDIVDNVSTMTITLKEASLATMANCFNKTLIITFMNGTVDKTSVKLTIQSPTPASSLTVTPAKGTATGTTSFNIATALGDGNKWVYVVGNDPISGVNIQDKVANKTTITPTSVAVGKTAVENIPTGLTQYLTIFELNNEGFIVKFKCIQITSEIRNQ
jgi:hypothetical protein